MQTQRAMECSGAGGLLRLPIETGLTWFIVPLFSAVWLCDESGCTAGTWRNVKRTLKLSLASAFACEDGVLFWGWVREVLILGTDRWRRN